MEEIKYSKDKRIAFTTHDHVYIDTKTGKRLTSVTQLVSKYKSPFDKDKISKAYAKKHKMAQEEVLELWAEKADTAATMGTYLHKMFEDYIIDGIVPEPSGLYLKEETVKSFIEDLFIPNRLYPMETELIVYNDNYAGQIDCIAMDNQNRFYILDWKSNKKIDYANRWQTMLPPYDLYEDVNLFHYSLQLKIYKELCKEYDITDCYIVHIGEPEEGYSIIPINNEIPLPPEIIKQ